MNRQIAPLPFLLCLCWLFILLPCLTLAQPYSQAFPSKGYLLIGQMQSDKQYAVYQMEHDSNSKKLVHRNLKAFNKCPIEYLYLTANAPNQFIVHSYKFISKTGLQQVYLDTSLLVQIHTNLNLMDTFSSGNMTYIYYQNDWHNVFGIADSVMIFYPFENGSVNTQSKPIIFGKTKGWIDGGDAFNFRILGYFDEHNKYNGIRRPHWKNFYPERAGDIKFFSQYHYPYYQNPNVYLGRLDSIQFYLDYGDSIQFGKSSWMLKNDWTYERPSSGVITISPQSYQLKWHLADQNFACMFNTMDTLHEGAWLFHNSFTYSPISDNWQFVHSFYGYTIADSCARPNIADAGNSEFFSEDYGYRGFILDGYSYVEEILSAAKLGNKSFGKLPTGMPPIAFRSLTMYPNPASKSVFLDDDLVEGRYSILDYSGKLIQNGYLKQNSIDLQTIPAGFYFLIVEKDGSRYTGKLQIISH